MRLRKLPDYFVYHFVSIIKSHPKGAAVAARLGEELAKSAWIQLRDIV